MTLRLAIVGAGRIASAYAEIVGSCDSVEAVGVADADPTAAKKLAGVLDCDAFDSHLSLIEGARPDAVILCTPPVTHPEITTDCLRSQVSVMCEKPLATTTSEARRMLAVAASSNAILTMASKFRYVRDVQIARELVASGAIGDVILVENTFASRVDMSGRWNSQPEIAGGGVLIDNGTHSVDLVRYFIGPIAEVMAVEGLRTQGLAVEDTAQLFLKSFEGVRATIDLSWSLNKEREWFLEIYGSQGTVQVGWGRSRYRLGDDDNWTDLGQGYSRQDAMRGQLANFAGAILGKEELVIDCTDAIASVEVIEAAYRSLRRDSWVDVYEPGFAS
ncbi:MAG TPA: Gfo/Idh/MocA family oxidoreductase [Acidimicrobiia bacterium]